MLQSISNEKFFGCMSSPIIFRSDSSPAFVSTISKLQCLVLAMNLTENILYIESTDFSRQVSFVCAQPAVDNITDKLDCEMHI